MLFDKNKARELRKSSNFQMFQEKIALTTTSSFTNAMAHSSGDNTNNKGAFSKEEIHKMHN